MVKEGKNDKKSYCKNLEWLVNQNTNHVISIEEYPERPSDLTVDGKIYKRVSNTKIHNMLSDILEKSKKCKVQIK